jgi:hypothetical protein
MSDQKPEVSTLTKTMLESGLVDESMAELMEKWGTLPEGSIQYINNDSLKNATRQQMQELVEKIGDGVETHRQLRETYFDLDRLKWPAEVEIWRWSGTGPGQRQMLATRFTTVVDRLGRYYFQVADVDRHGLSMFRPGLYLVYTVQKQQPEDGGFTAALARRMILESQFLYVGEARATLQVSTAEEEITPFDKPEPIVIDDRPKVGSGG